MNTAVRKSKFVDAFRAMLQDETESALSELDLFVGEILAGGTVDNRRLRELLRAAGPTLIHDEQERTDDALLASFELALADAEARGELIADREAARATNAECDALQARRDDINAKWAAELKPVELRLDEIAELRRKATRADEWLKGHLPRPVKAALSRLRREIHQLQRLVNETWSPITDAERPLVRRIDEAYYPETGSGIDTTAAAEAAATVTARLAERLEQREQAARRIEGLRDKEQRLMKLAYSEWPTADDVAKALEDPSDAEQADSTESE